MVSLWKVFDAGKHFQITEPSSVSTLTLTSRTSAEIAKEIRLVPNRRKLNIKLKLSAENQFGHFSSISLIFTRLSKHFLFSLRRIFDFEFGLANQTPISRVTVMFLCFLSLSCLVCTISSRIPSEQLLFWYLRVIKGYCLKANCQLPHQFKCLLSSRNKPLTKERVWKLFYL